MDLISIEKLGTGWKINYQSTRDFYQAVAPFLRFAIAISQLDRGYWLKYGTVTAIKLKEGKADQLTSSPA